MTPHPTPETSKLVRLLPGWMTMRTDPHSVGWRIINALHGLPHERIEQLTEWLDATRTVGTVDPLDVRRLYRVVLDDALAQDVTLASGFARVLTIDHVPVEIPLVDGPSLFFESPPTRWTHYPDQVVTPPDPSDYGASGILGVLFVVGHPLAPSGGYLVNYAVPAVSPSSTMLYDQDWVPLSGYAYGVGVQSYSATGIDEIIDILPGGTSGVLAHDPIDGGQLSIFDVLNLDASGNAREVPAEEFTLEANQVTFVDPSSLYIAEYS